MKKKGQCLVRYIRAVERLADTFAAVGQTLRAKEIIGFILDHRFGWAEADRTLVTLITNGKEDITINDLYTRLGKYEKRPARL